MELEKKRNRKILWGFHVLEFYESAGESYEKFRNVSVRCAVLSRVLRMGPERE
jgi:hypothetical protein